MQQLDPIYVDVTQSSNDFLRLKQELANGTLKQENGKAKVELVTNDGIKFPQEGTLEFSDVTVDQTTGSITLRAIFPNPDKNLLPCMFVRASGRRHQSNRTSGSTAGCDPYATWRCERAGCRGG